MSCTCVHGHILFKPYTVSQGIFRMHTDTVCTSNGIRTRVRTDYKRNSVLKKDGVSVCVRGGTTVMTDSLFLPVAYVRSHVRSHTVHTTLRYTVHTRRDLPRTAHALVIIIYTTIVITLLSNTV